MQTILAASGQYDLDEELRNFKDFEVIGTVEYKAELLKKLEEQVPDILVIGENIGGKEPLSTLLLVVKSKYPNLRIIYFAGELDYKDTVKLNTLGNLVSLGVYDIILESSIAISAIEFILKNPKSKDSVEYLIGKIKDSSYPISKAKRNIQIMYSEESLILEDGEILPNLHVFLSSSGGAGSSFLALNTAIAIAKNGISKEEGTKPNVCLIDLDLESYSIGVFTGATKEKINLMTIAQDLKRVINSENGEVKCDDTTLQFTIDNLKKCGKQYEGITVISGHDQNYIGGDNERLTPTELSFILDILTEKYDIVIADVKSDIEYNVLFPILFRARNIYNVIELNYASIARDKHFHSYFFDEIGIGYKFKYVLNKYVVHKDLLLKLNDLENHLDYQFVSTIPRMRDIDMLNYEYSGKSIFKFKPYLSDFIEASLYILADDIWRIHDIKKYNKKVQIMHKQLEADIEKIKEDEDKFFYEKANFFKFMKVKPSDIEDEDENEVSHVENKKKGFDISKMIKLFKEKKESLDKKKSSMNKSQEKVEEPKGNDESSDESSAKEE